MKKIIFILLIMICLFISGCIQEQRNLVSSNVKEVLDGDTIVLEDGMHVRLLNINAPELGEPCSQEAKTRLEQLVLNKTIWLERDLENQDKYNRELSYIFLSENRNPKNFDDLVNLILLEEGLVKLYIIEPNTKYENIFREKFDKVEKGCIFAKGEYSTCFEIIEFHYNAEGDDCSNTNDEYIILKNSCQDINMNNWTIKDSARNVYTFSNFFARQNQEFTLFTGSGIDSEKQLFGNKRCIWNNDHDTFYLYDSQGKLVLEENY